MMIIENLREALRVIDALPNTNPGLITEDEFKAMLEADAVRRRAFTPEAIRKLIDLFYAADQATGTHDEHEPNGCSVCRLLAPIRAALASLIRVA